MGACLDKQPCRVLIRGSREEMLILTGKVGVQVVYLAFEIHLLHPQGGSLCVVGEVMQV